MNRKMIYTPILILLGSLISCTSSKDSLQEPTTIHIPDLDPTPSVTLIIPATATPVPQQDTTDPDAFSLAAIR